MDTPANEQLLNFFKAMADANRLKIIGLLAREPLSVEQIAAVLDLRPSTISHHLGCLTAAGLVTAHPESYYNVYQLKPGVLEHIAESLLAKDTLPNIAASLNVDAYDRKVLHDFLLPDGHLKEIPAQRKKREAVLHYVVETFEPSRSYSEKQVNEILARFHSDTATLRRELLAYKLLSRQGSEYQRVEAAAPAA